MYRGMVPILASTSIQKSALFAAYAGGRRMTEDSGIAALTQPIPLTGGLMPSVIVGGVASGTARAIVETPFELAKVSSNSITILLQADSALHFVSRQRNGPCQSDSPPRTCA